MMSVDALTCSPLCLRSRVLARRWFPPYPRDTRNPSYQTADPYLFLAFGNR